MFTDSPPGKNRTEFFESDRVKTLDLPPEGKLVDIAKRLESAMKADTILEVRSTCAEFLTSASDFYKVPICGIRVLAALLAASAGELRDRTFWRLPSRYNAHPGMDADSSTERGHLLRGVPEYVMP